MKRLIQKFLEDDSGASLIEYVLIGAVISIGTLALMTQVNTDVGTVWTRISAALNP
jgi:pilus assembly protein Flp/PilA